MYVVISYIVFMLMYIVINIFYFVLGGVIMFDFDEWVLV